MGLNKIEISELSSEQLSQTLIDCVKKKDTKNAAALIESGADSNYADEAGCTPLHYAALEGYVDLIVQMIQNGGNVRKVDMNGETAIHKAARKGHIEVIVAIVAHGGDINILNMHGHSGLELSVIRKDANAVRLFCKLGAEAALQDWVWTVGDTNVLGKKDKWVLDLLVLQSSRYPGYKYGGISFKVVQVQPGTDDIKIGSLGISIQPYNILNSFYLYCGKMHPEYSNARDRLQQHESLFSDVVELIVWGKKPGSLKLKITVPGKPSCGERLSLFSIDGSVNGTIDEFEKIETDDQDDSNVSLPCLLT
ncbi:ankyrin repeat, PH and SEC7 domain containing protein secG-like [Mytilus trossulus]|uniref:ankyrin repeat, PH and SEC7 domain containing protein secG-like n=1 Tax=Mytilus trossulus TaxID=6551 RepID=UPI003005CB3D